MSVQYANVCTSTVILCVFFSFSMEALATVELKQIQIIHLRPQIRISSVLLESHKGVCVVVKRYNLLLGSVTYC